MGTNLDLTLLHIGFYQIQWRLSNPHFSGCERDPDPQAIDSQGIQEYNEPGLLEGSNLTDQTRDSGRR